MTFLKKILKKLHIYYYAAVSQLETITLSMVHNQLETN